MSIILRALKKIQNQEGNEKQFIEAQTGEELSPGFSPDKASLAEAVNPSEFASGSGSYSEKALSPDYPETAETGDKKDRISRIPRLLIGMLIVLGIVSTGWFFNVIYKNHSDKEKVVQQARQEEEKAAEPAQPEPQPAKAAPEPASVAATVVLSASAEVPPAAVPKKPVAKPAPPPAQPDVPSPQAQPVAQETPAPDELPSPATEDLEMPVLEPGIRDPLAFAEASIDFPLQSKEASFVPEREPVEKKERPELKINAIAWRSEEPKAIVNMQRVYVGDVVDGALVKQIGRKSITFEFEGEEFEVRF
jgi:hypothetical protein